MLIDDAKDTISRIIRESLPPESRDVPSAPTSGFNFFGGSNVVQIHIGAASAALPEPTPQKAPAAPVPRGIRAHPAMITRRRTVLLQQIARRETELGKPHLSLRFFKSIYSTTDIGRLDESQLERALRWLEEYEK